MLAGIDDPNLFGRLNSAYISLKSGVKPETVSKHQEMICSRLGIIPPQKYTSNRLTKGKAELLGLSGIKDYMIEQLYRNGIVDGESLSESDPDEVSRLTGLPVEKVKKIQRLKPVKNLKVT